MNIIVPLSAADASQFASHVAWMLKFGGLETHYLTYVPAPSVVPVIEERLEELKAICPNVSIRPIESEPMGGWPMAPNYHFYCGSKIAQEMKLPWLWLEMDGIGRCKGWADKLAMALGMAAPAQYVGHVCPYQSRDEVTGRLSSPFGPSDTFMYGVGMYPYDLFTKGQSLMADFSKGTSSCKDPFDQYLRAIMKQQGMAHTPLIDDQWNTKNYRWENGDLLCDPQDVKPGWPTRRGKVNPAAVLIHGCKDDSLFNIIMAQDESSPMVVSMPSFTAPIGALPPIPPLQEKRLNDLENKVDVILEAIKGLAQNKQLEPVKADPISEQVPATMDGTPFEQACAIIDQRKITVSALSKECGIASVVLKHKLEELGYTFNGPAQWIVKPEPAMA